LDSKNSQGGALLILAFLANLAGKKMTIKNAAQMLVDKPWRLV
jgi:hypothetical protein